MIAAIGIDIGGTNIMPNSPEPVHIVPAELGDNAGVFGATGRCLIG